MASDEKQVSTKPKRKPSLRAQKAVSLLVGKGRSKAEALRKAGYSESVADQPQKVFDSPTVKPIIDAIVADLIKQRDLAIKRMNETVGSAKYKDVVDAVDKLTKNIQLLSGGATDNVAVVAVVSDERKAQLDAILMKKQ